jgi:glycosyltransferase involved in cell wall biosynthesis
VNLVIVGSAAHYWKEKFKYDWIIPKVVDNKELKKLYARAIALTLPSTFEGFSYTLSKLQQAVLQWSAVVVFQKRH